MSNWNEVLSSTRNLNDVLIVLQKVLALLQSKVDINTTNETLESLAAFNQQLENCIRQINLVENKTDRFMMTLNDFSLLQQASSLTGNELMLVSQEEKTLNVTVDQLLNYLSAKLPPSVVEKPTLSIAALLNQQQIIGNTSAQAAITAFIDDSLTANMRADGLEIKGKAQPNSTIIVEY